MPSPRSANQEPELSGEERLVGVRAGARGGQITLVKICYRPTICVGSLITLCIVLQEITAAHGLYLSSTRKLQPLTSVSAAVGTTTEDTAVTSAGMYRQSIRYEEHDS